MASRVALAVPILAFCVGVAAYGQGAQQPVSAQPGSTIIINTAPPPEPVVDPCSPLNRRLNKDGCDALLLPTQVIRMKPGTGRTLRFDRAFKRIEIQSDPEGAIDVQWADNQLFTIVKAVKEGQAELLIFGDEGKPGAAGKRDILFSGTIVSSNAPPPPVIIPPPLDNSSRVQVHNQKSLSDSNLYDCTQLGCTKR